MTRWLVLAVASCTTSVDAPPVALRVDPPSLDLQVVLGAPPPVAAIRVYAASLGGERDVTDDATFTLAGAPLGAVAGGSFASDGLTGGSATIDIAYAGASLAMPIAANVYERRVAGGAPPSLDAAFASASPVVIDASLSPGDGSVLPPNLGALALDFTAADTDDAHEARIVAPYLDIAIDVLGSAGPRELALTSTEWQAIAHTAGGGSIDVTVASLQTSAPATARVAFASYGIADLAASSVLAGMVVGSAAPAFERYDMASASLEPMLVGPNGGCVGCHVAVSADGSRIAAGTAVEGTPGASGILFDGHTGAILATSIGSAAPWLEAAFDPSGAMIGAYQGALAVRDGTTAAMIAPIATGELATSPTVSPDGSLLAYTELDEATAMLGNPLGDAIHVRAWNAATAAVGPARELVRDGGGVVMPTFSSDGEWIAFGHTPDLTTEVPDGAKAVRTDGTGVISLTTDPADQLARWASPIAPAHVAGRDAEPMVWIALSSARPVPNAPAGTRQLWLEALFPDRGVVAPAFHLPGQGSAEMLHGPVAVP